MGACMSVSPHSATLPDLQDKLQTGDIILLLDGSKSSKYLIKAGSAGSWVRASKAGFVVRNQNSGGELVLYHADDPLPSAPGMTRITGVSLTEELQNNSTYRLAIVRRLRTPLSPQKVALIEDFVALNNGAVIPEQQRPSSVLMASSTSTTQAFEYLDCSDFVMMMLHLVGLVEPTQNPFEYVASDSRGRLLAPPVAIKLKSSTSTTTNSTNSSTPSTSTATTTTTATCRSDNSQFSALNTRTMDAKVLLASTTSTKNQSKIFVHGEHTSTDSSTSPTSVVAHAHQRSLKSSLDETESNKSAPATPKKNSICRSPPPPLLSAARHSSE